MPGVSMGSGVSLGEPGNYPSYSEIASNVAPLLPSVIIPGEYTVATLPTPDSSMVDRYARVTDLFGDKRDLVLCSQVGGNYFWQPIRPTYAKSMSGNQSMTLTALKNPSVLFLTGTLSANRTLTLSTDLAYPGATFEIAMEGTLGLFGLNIAGLDGGSLLSLLFGGRRRVFFDGSSNSWKQF